MGDAYLILENGTVFKGQQLGHDSEVVGELVFSTSMTGYMETLTDPRYFGQIVLQTFPLIGNYGVIPDEMRSPEVHAGAYVVRDCCQEPSNFRSEGNLDSFLSEMKTTGLSGIDTRALTRVIRENGTMNAMISKTPKLSEEQWSKLREHKVTDAVASLPRSSTQTAPPEKEQGTQTDSPSVLIWDFGDASWLAKLLAENGCSPTVVAFDSTADSILAHNPGGVALTCGPGNPADQIAIIEEIKKLCDRNIPILAVGLGHQMLALAHGAKTGKLPFGHRGANQPVSECGTGRAFVTSQNHGYAVLPHSLPDTAEMSHVNINDGSCEGVVYKTIPAISVQFDPGEDTINRFAEMMRG